ncbi:MAG: hypothetical protein ACREIF_11140 [Chthoniobacterales bacterium]
MRRAACSFAVGLFLTSRCLGVTPDEPEVEVVAAGELQPGQPESGPVEEIGDSDENNGAPGPHHALPPPMPPNHGHVEHSVSPEPSVTPGKNGPRPEADIPLGWSFDAKIDLGSDPQLAVGSNFIIGVDASKIAFYDKTGQLLPMQKQKKNPGSTPSPTPESTNQFFAVFLQPHLNGDKAKNLRDVNWNLANTHNTTKELGCDPENPNKLGGCIVQAYDTRVLYDGLRGRFWIEDNLRNEVQTDNGNCHPDQEACVRPDSPWKQRFQAVAVSKTSDPRDGFFSVVFHLNHPGDWPRIAVHRRYFILGSNGSTTVHLFDADAIANGKRGIKDLLLATLTGSDLGDPAFVYPVVQHDKRDGSSPFEDPFFPGTGDTTDVPTFLLTTNGSRVTIFAFEDFQPSPAQTKPRLMSASIDLGHDAPHLFSPAVYRDGKIYMAGKHCVWGDGRDCRAAVSIVVIPVFRDGKTIGASKSIKKGFSDFLLGGDYGPDGSYEIPAIEVNKDNDMAVVYDRAEPGGGVPFFSGAPASYYSIFLHDETGHRSGVLHKADCTPIINPLTEGCWLPSPDLAHLDVAGIAVDPSDDTKFWMSHGYGSSGTDNPEPGRVGTYKMVIGSVVARTRGSAPAHPKQVP